MEKYIYCPGCHGCINPCGKTTEPEVTKKELIERVEWLEQEVHRLIIELEK